LCVILVTGVTNKKMGFFSRIRRFFTRKKTTQLGTIYVKPSEVSQFKDTSKITVVDTSKTISQIIPSGSISRQISGGTFGGGGISAPAPTTTTPQLAPEVQKEIFKTSAPAPPTTIVLQDQKKLETQLKAIEEKVTAEPLGTPKITTKKSRLKRFGQITSDIFTGLTFGLLTPTATTSFILTGKKPKEVKKEIGEIPKRAIKEATTIVGVGLPAGFGVKGTGKVGVGQSSLIASLQLQQILSAIKIRGSGERTLSAQKIQVKEIDKVVKRISEEQAKLSDTIQFTKDSEKLSKDISKFNKEIATMKTISNIGAFPERIKRAERQRKGLVDIREDLLKQQKQFEREQKKFEQEMVSELKKLRVVGVESTFTKTGEIKFTSKELGKTVAPVGIKLQKSFLKDDKLTTKNILLGSTAIAREVGVMAGIGYATGGVGVLARIGSKVARLPRIARVCVKAGAVGLAGAGITVSTIRGFKLGELEGIGKIGAVVGGAKATGQIVGFGAGGFKGTKIHLAKIEKEILSGKTTKSLMDIKAGVIFKGKGGLAKQLSKFETRVKGTKFKITSMAELQSKFIKKMGVSNIKILSKITGKVPKGFPSKVITKGQSLETEDLIRARLFTKVPKIKGLLKQDILISRKILEMKAVSLKPFFKPFTKLERLKVISGMKTVGAPVKVKKIPKDIFTAGERYLFRVSKGRQKVAGFGEFAEARPDMLFTSKQFILSTKPVKLRDLEVSTFKVLATTKGISKDILKDSLKGKLLVLDLKTKQLSAIGLDKKGQVAVFRPSRLKVPDLVKPLKIKLDFKPSVDTKDLLKINLKQLVPKLLAREGALIKPTIIPTSASALGLKDILKLKVAQIPKIKTKFDIKQLSKLKLDLGFKVAQITQMKLIQAPSLKVAQIPKISLITVPVTKLTTIPAPPKITIPVIPMLPTITLGKIRKKKKRKAGETPLGEITFTEGFTAKQLDFAPRVMTKAQLKKLISINLTGIGIRRGVIVK
jgi:hypothetical protein